MLAALPLGGCALSAPPPRNGRYSVDITELQRSERYKNTWIYRSPTRRMADFHQFLVHPVTVYEDPVRKIRDRTPYNALQDKLTVRTLATMKKDHHPVVDAPSAGTLDMRIAIVDLKPVVEMKDAQKNEVVRMNTTTKGTKIEIDCHDAVTNEQIFAMSTIYQGPEFAAYEDPALLANVEQAFGEWSDYFRARFNEALTSPRALPSPSPR